MEADLAMRRVFIYRTLYFFDGVNDSALVFVVGDVHRHYFLYFYFIGLKSIN